MMERKRSSEDRDLRQLIACNYVGAACKVSPLLLRCSVGLEEVEHLKLDLQRAIVEVSSA